MPANQGVIPCYPPNRWRWRPRFSLRTLAIVMSLVCAYFGAWEATKRYGVPKTPFYTDPVGVFSASSPLPFIVSQDEVDYPSGLPMGALVQTSDPFLNRPRR